MVSRQVLGRLKGNSPGLMEHDPLSPLPITTATAEGSVPDRLAAVAQQFGSRTAVSSAGRAFTYIELDQLSARAAGALLDRGTARGDRVAVIGNNGPEMMAALFGAMRAGAVAVPLDPTFPAERNERIVSVAGATRALVVPAQPGLTVVPGIDLKNVICVEEGELPDADSRGLPTCGPDDIALMLFTSGSTGRPKGVVHTHRSLLHIGLRRTRSLAIKPADRLSLFYSASVMGGIYGITGALFNGAALHTYGVRREGIGGIVPWLRENKITIYHSVSSLFRRLASVMGEVENLADLRMIVLGGEAALITDVESSLKLLPRGGCFVGGLGSSETGTVCSIQIKHGDPLLAERSVPLGRPVDDVAIELVDEDGDPTPPGGIGEIVVRSRYLAAGYWNDPKSTKEVFSVDSEEPQSTCYRMGDLARRDQQGILWHCGRRDAQVKVRGFRVETGEVEATLLRHPSVAEVGAVVATQKEGESILVAFIVARESRVIDAAELRNHCMQTLPIHMVPSHFHAIDVLPRTVSGKIDRRVLGELANQCETVEQAPLAVERNAAPLDVLIGLWGAVLHNPSTSADTAFFEAGGDSLGAMELVVRIEKSLGRRVSLRALSVAQTPRAMADFVARSTEEAEPVFIPLRPEGNGPPLFCFPPWDGCVHYFGRLVRSLKMTRPILGLEPHVDEDGQVLVNSVEELAAKHAIEISRRQPSGPVLMCAYSSGVLFAWETARRLRVLGREIAFLGIIDAPHPGLLAEDTGSGAKFVRRMSEAMRLGPLRLAAFLVGRRRKSGGALPGDPARPEDDPRIAAILARKRGVTRAYMPPADDLNVTVFRAKEQPRIRLLLDETLGWKGIARAGMRVREVSGDHDTIVLGADVAELAKSIDVELAAIRPFEVE